MTTVSQARPVVEVSRLRAYYQTHQFGVQRDVRAVDDVSLKVMPNEIYGLAGESSCGKSTLIKTIAGAIRPPLKVQGGHVVFNFGGREMDLYQSTPEALDAIRWKHLSYVMQGSMGVLNPVRRVKHSFVDFAYRHIHKPMPEFMALVRHHLGRVHLGPEVLEAFPHELSGGMRQRLAIALATVCKPELIIADEPTTALDVIVQKGVLGMIREVQRELKTSMIFVTHDMAVHAHLCDRLGVMYAGRLIEEGATRDIFNHPRHPYTTHLIASLPRIGSTVAIKALEGAPPNLADPPKGCRFHPRCPLAMDICQQQVPAFAEVAPGHRVACFAVNPVAVAEPVEVAA
ncbi:ABC transporter ATP-binding protein [Rhodoferax koreense]|uniref:ABC transporter ATP-binding protein n=1 Tax=Rhodoferax koreensis TaxID=1842727 RepID=A0A1P8K2A3_9BURK|nr:ABC transporter ATP-binding protein [Rhodoferax koreense]APW40116.1 ABC transporter ATP-binding protein [Rhodoferax koreense]